MTDELLSVVRIYGGYAVLLDDDAQLEDSDLVPGSIVAAFATQEQADRYAQWLTILRSGYHGARPVYL